MTCGNPDTNDPLAASQASSWLSWGVWDAGSETSNSSPALSAALTTSSGPPVSDAGPNGAMIGTPRAGTLVPRTPVEFEPAPAGPDTNTLGRPPVVPRASLPSARSTYTGPTSLCTAISGVLPGTEATAGPLLAPSPMSGRRLGSRSA